MGAARARHGRGVGAAQAWAWPSPVARRDEGRQGLRLVENTLAGRRVKPTVVPAGPTNKQNRTNNKTASHQKAHLETLRAKERGQRAANPL